MKELLLLPESYTHKCGLSTILGPLLSTQIALTLHLDRSCYLYLMPMKVSIAFAGWTIARETIEAGFAFVALGMLNGPDLECLEHQSSSSEARIIASSAA